MAASVGVMSTSVFELGRHPVEVKHVDSKTVAVKPPKQLLVAVPVDEGTYPVLLFLHGFMLHNDYYKQLLTHIASHGFIVVAPQLFSFLPNPNDYKDIDSAKRVANWLPEGLPCVLNDTLGLHSVKPDLDRLALAGHSRGGDTAFSVALGLPGADPKLQIQVKLSALIGVDPVAGLSKQLQIQPKILTDEPFDLAGTPVLVIGTGLGSQHVGGIPCAPKDVGHVEFYKRCRPPRYHVVTTEYGHLDMLDDDVPFYIKWMCMPGQGDHVKDLARRSMAGVTVAFLRAWLEGKRQDLDDVLVPRACAGEAAPGRVGLGVIEDVAWHHSHEEV